MSRATARRPGNATLGIETNHSAGVRVGEMIFVGGQVDFGEESRILHPGDLAAQTEAAVDAVEAVLEELGATIEDVVKINTFYKDVTGWDPEQLHANLAIRSGCFSRLGPVSTAVPLEALGLEDVEIEIEAYAMLEESPG